MVLCDLEMPRLDGYSFLGRIKAHPQLHPIPVAMLTSRSGDKHRQLALNLGAVAYFSKPYNEHSLLRAIQSLLVPNGT
jgi:two-component system, chemotaxis family, sensor histidine kinase and response regulator PixL